MEIQKLENGPQGFPFALVEDEEVMALFKTEEQARFLQWFYLLKNLKSSDQKATLEIISDFLQSLAF